MATIGCSMRLDFETYANTISFNTADKTCSFYISIKANESSSKNVFKLIKPKDNQIECDN